MPQSAGIRGETENMVRTSVNVGAKQDCWQKVGRGQEWWTAILALTRKEGEIPLRMGRWSCRLVVKKELNVSGKEVAVMKPWERFKF